jgi:hypothetical protein
MPVAGSSSRSPPDIFSQSQTIGLSGFSPVDEAEAMYFEKPGSNPGEFATCVPSTMPWLGFLQPQTAEQPANRWLPRSHCTMLKWCGLAEPSHLRLSPATHKTHAAAPEFLRIGR